MTDQKIAHEKDLLSGRSQPGRDVRALRDIPKRSLLDRARSVAINVFILFHLLVIVCWSVPFNANLLTTCRNVVRPYVLWAGLFQSWDMFAPVPKRANTYIEATLVYRDGTTKTWTFPRIEQMGLWEKISKERYRKFAENLQADELDPLLTDAARHIARLNSTPANPVKTVILIQNASFIVPRKDGVYTPEPWQSHVLLGYGVRPEDLQ